MARRKKTEEADETREAPSPAVTKQSIHRAFLFTGWTLGLVLSVFGVAWVVFQGEQFLSSDARFRLAPEGPAARQDSIRVNGLRNASRASVLKVFNPDRGRSLADLKVDERRMQLRTVDWVRDASVRRIWPNQVQIDITERVPVAIVPVAARLTGRATEPVTYQPMLIDEEGFLLRPRGAIPNNLPVLTGLRSSDDVEARRLRVVRMQRLMEELRDYRAHVAEVDVSDLESLRISYQMQDQQVILVLGNERYLDRLHLFLSHYDGIRDRVPPRAVLDVSLEGQITIVEGSGAGDR